MGGSVYYDCNSSFESFAAKEPSPLTTAAATIQTTKLNYLLDFPKYMPPHLDALIFFDMLQMSTNHRMDIEEPQLPKVRTNTNMATYAHKLFMYKFRLCNAYNAVRRPRDPSSYAILKHSYDECLSQHVAVSLVRQNTTLRVKRRQTRNT